MQNYLNFFVKSYNFFLDIIIHKASSASDHYISSLCRKSKRSSRLGTQVPRAIDGHSILRATELVLCKAIAIDSVKNTAWHG